MSVGFLVLHLIPYSVWHENNRVPNGAHTRWSRLLLTNQSTSLLTRLVSHQHFTVSGRCLKRVEKHDTGLLLCQVVSCWFYFSTPSQFPCKCGLFTKQKTLPTSGLAWTLQRFQHSVASPCKRCLFSKCFHHGAQERDWLSGGRHTMQPRVSQQHGDARLLMGDNVSWTRTGGGLK